VKFLTQLSPFSSIHPILKNIEVIGH